jgi:hypothetical protein
MPTQIWPNLIWPSPRRPDVGTAGALGRVIHWACVVLAGLCLLLAAEFAIEGWADDLGVQLLVAAVALAVGSRAILYVLARE